MLQLQSGSYNKSVVTRRQFATSSFLLSVGAIARAEDSPVSLRGKLLQGVLTLPDGKTKTLLSISDWDFAWQDRYYFKQFVPLPAGTRLDVEIHWDNSADNPRNPANPPVRVKWGEESKDEMGSISLIAVPHDESDLGTLQADIRQRNRQIAREKMRDDPALAKKVMQMLAE